MLTNAIPVAAAAPDTPTIMSQMRKWGYTFDGRNLLAFLERFAELSEVWISWRVFSTRPAGTAESLL